MIKPLLVVDLLWLEKKPHHIIGKLDQVLIQIDGILHILEYVQEALPVIPHGRISVEQALCIEAYGDLKLGTKPLVSENLAEDPLVLVLDLDQVREDDLQNELSEPVEKLMTLFEYPVLLIFCLFLPLLLCEDDQVLTPTTIALLNDAHHMSLLNRVVETEVII